MNTKKLILASNSPRRKQLLQEHGFDFEIKVSEYEEQDFCIDPILTATTFAKGKALGVYNELNDFNNIVIGADTVVFCDDKILGKPKDEKQAYAMLKTLSNKTHSVATGFCIKSDEVEVVDYDVTFVTFNDLTDKDIQNYIDSGLYKGKAGSYGIQDKDFNLVKSYNGSLNNVIGLPTEKLVPILKEIMEKD